VAPDPIIGACNSLDIRPGAAYLRESGAHGIPLIFFQQGQKQIGLEHRDFPFCCGAVRLMAKMVSHFYPFAATVGVPLPERKKSFLTER